MTEQVPPAPVHRLAARMIAPLLVAARGCGLDVARLLDDAGVDPQVARKRGVEDHVTLSQYGRLWETAVVRSGRVDLPLLAAAALGSDSFGVIGFALMTSPTIGAAFDRLARYCRALSTASCWSRVDQAPDHVALVFDIQPGPPLATRCAIEFALAESVHFSTLMAGRRVPALETRLPHPPPADDRPYRDFFGTPLRWNAGHAALVIPSSALDLPLLKADPHLLAYFEAQAEALVRKGEQEISEPLSAQVRRRVIDGLPSGPPALPAVARGLGCSARSLRRHLAEEGTSFHQLVDEIRSQLAARYLNDPKVTVSEVAFLVGFSELSPFLRAFRRWTGLTPSEFRQRAGAQAASG